MGYIPGHDCDICDLFSHVVSKKVETIITQPAGAMREVVRIQAASPVIQAGGYAQGVTPVEAASQLMNSQRHEPMPTVVRLNREVMPEWLRNVHGLLRCSLQHPAASRAPSLAWVWICFSHRPWRCLSRNRTKLIRHCMGLGLYRWDHVRPKPKMGASGWDRLRVQQHVCGIGVSQQPCEFQPSAGPLSVQHHVHMQMRRLQAQMSKRGDGDADGFAWDADSGIEGDDGEAHASERDAESIRIRRHRR